MFIAKEIFSSHLFLYYSPNKRKCYFNKIHKPLKKRGILTIKYVILIFLKLLFRTNERVLNERCSYIM